jgi:hypothetical protein
MKNLILILTIIFYASIANAQNQIACDKEKICEDQSDAVFKNKNQTLALLASEGIPHTSVITPEISAVCLGLSSNSNPVLYNKCIYNTTKNKVLYISNNKSCATASREEYPDLYLREKLIEIQANKPSEAKVQALEIDEAVKKSTSTIKIPPLKPSELASLRAGYIVKCMQQNGWNDPENWKLGKVR